MTTTAPPVAVTAATASDAELTGARDELRVLLNSITPMLADRSDVLLDVAYDLPGSTAPAWFDPATAVITLNGDIALAGAHPDDIDPTTPTGRLEHPEIIGLQAHEASHAHSTRWHDAIAPDTPAATIAAATLLEDIRIEARQIARRPGDRLYLRAASRYLEVPAKPPEPDQLADAWRAAAAAVLLLGRVDAGVLTVPEVAAARPVLADALGPELLDTLQALWGKALMLLDGDGPGLLAVATDFAAAVLGDQAETHIPPGARCCSPLGGPGHDPDDPAPSPDTDPLTDAISAVLIAVANDASAEAATEAEALTPAAPEPDPAKKIEAKAKAAAEKAATIFTSPASRKGGPGRNPITGHRDPTDEERAAASHLAAALRKAQFRERTVTVAASAAPPGRLNGRAAMQSTAQRAMHMPVTAKPFRQRTRRKADRPRLSIGIAVDVSGSMWWAAQILSSAAWVIAQAASRAEARSATVAFGSTLTPITAPGRRPDHVTVLTAADNTEEFADAVRSLDCALNLATGTGARVLVVVSDGHYRQDQLAQAPKLIKRLTAAGVAVVWLDIRGTANVPEGAVRVHLAEPLAAIEAIVDAALGALRAA